MPKKRKHSDAQIALEPVLPARLRSGSNPTVKIEVDHVEQPVPEVAHRITAPFGSMSADEVAAMDSSDDLHEAAVPSEERKMASNVSLQAAGAQAVDVSSAASSHSTIADSISSSSSASESVPSSEGVPSPSKKAKSSARNAYDEFCAKAVAGVNFAGRKSSEAGYFVRRKSLGAINHVRQHPLDTAYGVAKVAGAAVATVAAASAVVTTAPVTAPVAAVVGFAGSAGAVAGGAAYAAETLVKRPVLFTVRTVGNAVAHPKVTGQAIVNNATNVANSVSNKMKDLYNKVRKPK